MCFMFFGFGDCNLIVFLFLRLGMPEHPQELLLGVFFVFRRFIKFGALFGEVLWNRISTTVEQKGPVFFKLAVVVGGA